MKFVIRSVLLVFMVMGIVGCSDENDKNDCNNSIIGVWENNETSYRFRFDEDGRGHHTEIGSPIRYSFYYEVIETEIIFTLGLSGSIPFICGDTIVINDKYFVRRN
ncbi:MAG: hypothetical protein FWE23_10055 [Chitinivibrionia bacterium]|nr:hypothetical protein [Chitinivibrionia bacterium]